MHWLTYAIRIDEENVFPSLFRRRIIDVALLAIGSVLFLSAFIFWLTNLNRGGGLITGGV